MAGVPFSLAVRSFHHLLAGRGRARRRQTPPPRRFRPHVDALEERVVLQINPVDHGVLTPLYMAQGSTINFTDQTGMIGMYVVDEPGNTHLAVHIVTPPNNVSGFTPRTRGGFSLTAEPGYVGPIEFTFQASDDDGAHFGNVATFRLTVVPQVARPFLPPAALNALAAWPKDGFDLENTHHAPPFTPPLFDPGIAWFYDTGADAGIYGSPVIAPAVVPGAPGGPVQFASESGTITSLDGALGPPPVWGHTAVGFQDRSSGLALASSLLLPGPPDSTIAGNGGYILSLSTAMGTVNWSNSTGETGHIDPVRAAPTIANGMLYVGDNERTNDTGGSPSLGRLYALEPNGTIVWQVNFAGHPVGTPALEGSLSPFLYVFSDADLHGNAHLYQIAAFTGAIGWDYAMPAGLDLASSPVFSTGEVFAVSNASTGTLVAIDAGTGMPSWAAEISHSTNPGLALDEAAGLLFCTNGGGLSAYDLAGDHLYDVTIPGDHPVGSPVIVGSDVYFATALAHVMAATVSEVGGMVVWDVDPLALIGRGESFSGSMAVDVDGSVYIGSTTGDLIKIVEGLGGITLGGPTPAAGNKLSGAPYDGTYGSVQGEMTRDNFLGTAFAGADAFGQVASGVAGAGASNAVGRWETGASNVISGIRSGTAILGSGDPPVENTRRLDRGRLETWAADVRRLAEDDLDVMKWAEAFLGGKPGHSEVLRPKR
jgi:hypothetical protein